LGRRRAVVCCCGCCCSAALRCPLHRSRLGTMRNFSPTSSQQTAAQTRTGRAYREVHAQGTCPRYLLYEQNSTQARTPTTTPATTYYLYIYILRVATMYVLLTYYTATTPKAIATLSCRKGGSACTAGFRSHAQRRGWWPSGTNPGQAEAGPYSIHYLHTLGIASSWTAPRLL
jgi:hypothetical protein